jgi:murein DD-endopeptidase MepM/ murein hydrolase activator NlpD
MRYPLPDATTSIHGEFMHPRQGLAGRRSLILSLVMVMFVIAGIPGSSHAVSTSLTNSLTNDESAIAVQSNPRWRAPLSGTLRVVRGFEPAPTPWGAGHRGVDLGARSGTAVRSAGSGVVVFARNLAGRGVVSVEHAPGIRTTYEPVRAVIREGSFVSAGTLLGYLTDGGHQPGALHWGLRIRGSYADPMRLLRGASILKPTAPRIMHVDGPA